MRFRFSIRDLLWLTLVVAMGLGWGIREGRFRGEANRAKAWRMRTGALEKLFNGLDWYVRWDLGDRIGIMHQSGPYVLRMAEVCEPSIQDD
jgi:hypothetical protein